MFTASWLICNIACSFRRRWTSYRAKIQAQFRNSIHDVKKRNGNKELKKLSTQNAKLVEWPLGIQKEIFIIAVHAYDFT
jgi:hypothetical protein